MPLPVLPAGSKLLVEFRAGRILKEGTTAKPDTRKGLVRVLRVRTPETVMSMWLHVALAHGVGIGLG